MSLQSRAPIHAKSGTNDSMKVITFVHQWSIDNFPYRNPKTGLHSHYFPSTEEFEYQFCLSLRDNELFCKLAEDSYNKLRESYRKINAHIKTSFLHVTGKKLFTKEIHHSFSSRDFRVCITDFFSREVILNPVNQILFDNKLTIFCELSILHDPVQTEFVSSISITNRMIESVGSLTVEEAISDFKSLFISGKLADIVLVVDCQSIPAHKAILAARSKVFAAMFEFDSKAKQENRVVITDVKVHVFNVLLRFIYTGKITSSALDRYTEELLAAAYKFQLDSLKDICESTLCLKLSPETAPSFLILADMHNAQKLKAKALEFMRSNAQKTFQALLDSGDSVRLIETFRNSALKTEKDY